jgi:hypothetical protein
VTRHEGLGLYCLTFSDGYRLRFSLYLRGAEQLVSALPRTVR